MIRFEIGEEELLIDERDLNVENLAFSYFDEVNGTQELEFILNNGMTVLITNILPDEEVVDENFWDNRHNVDHYVGVALNEGSYKIYL